MEKGRINPEKDCSTVKKIEKRFKLLFQNFFLDMLHFLFKLCLEIKLIHKKLL